MLACCVGEGFLYSSSEEGLFRERNGEQNGRKAGFWLVSRFLLLGCSPGRKKRGLHAVTIKTASPNGCFSLFLGLALPVERLDDRNEKDHRVVKEQTQRPGLDDFVMAEVFSVLVQEKLVWGWKIPYARAAASRCQ